MPARRGERRSGGGGRRRDGGSGGCRGRGLVNDREEDDFPSLPFALSFAIGTLCGTSLHPNVRSLTAKQTLIYFSP